MEQTSVGAGLRPASPLIALLEAYTRQARSTEDLQVAILEGVASKLSAPVAIMYVCDNAGLQLSIAPPQSCVLPAREFVATAWIGLPENYSVPPRIFAPVPSDLEADDIAKTLPPISGLRALAFAIQSEKKTRGIVCVFVKDTAQATSQTESITDSLREAGVMLDLLTDRFLQKQLVALNSLGHETPITEPRRFMCRLLERAREYIGCEGLSFFAIDPTDDETKFWLVATAPQQMPKTQISYSLTDANVTSCVLRGQVPCALHYVEKLRNDFTGFSQRRWCDVAQAITPLSVIYLPVVKGGQTVALLRCTNPNARPGRLFNNIDIHRGEAFASLLRTWHTAAENDYRFAVSLMNISHEMVTSTLAIKSAARGVGNELRKESAKKYEKLCLKLGDIVSTAENLDSMLPALRKESQALPESAGTVSASPVSFRPFADLCKPLVEAVSGDAGRRGITIKILGQDQLGLIYADIEDFRHVVQNLLSNAVKYTIPGNEILVQLKRFSTSREFAAINVVSESFPIRHDEREAIFGFRYRAISAKATSQKGQGLGLAIARAKSRQLKGDIVLTTSGPFNAFSFLIPMELFRQQ
jgi:signal transduction histidine kinase